MTEIYKDIKDLEGLYQVSNFGQILSLNYRGTGKPKLLKPLTEGGGYLFVHLYKNRKRKKFKVHRLVAEHFIPNPNNLPCVNHKDENKENNSVENLEYCTYEYNCNYGTRNERAGKAISKAKKGIPNEKCSKKILQFTLDGEFIREWQSMAECTRNGFDQSNVCNCCQGKRKSAYGYIWKYKE